MTFGVNPDIKGFFGGEPKDMNISGDIVQHISDITLHVKKWLALS